MEAVVAKVLALFSILLLSLAFGLAPLKLRYSAHAHNKRFECIVGYLNCLTGGIFLGLCFLELHPHVRDSVNASLLKPFNVDYPLDGLFIAVGFFLILLSETGVVTIYKRRNQKATRNATEEEDTNKVLKFEEYQSINGESNVGAVRDISDADDVINETTKQQQYEEFYNEEENSDDNEVRLLTRSILMLIALSIHSHFEGLALGLQRTASKVLTFFIAIIGHNCIIVFCLATSLVRCRRSVKQMVVYVIVFVINVPIGIAVGICITESAIPGKNLEMISALVLGIATGTIYYVTFVSMLCHELSHTAPISKVFTVMLGFAIMAVIECLH